MQGWCACRGAGAHNYMWRFASGRCTLEKREGGGGRADACGVSVGAVVVALETVCRGSGGSGEAVETSG